MTLQQITTDIWDFGDFEKVVPGCHFPARTVVVRLADGRLVLYAPLAIDDALAAELAAVGPVGWIVAPNGFHHRYVAAAQARYPEAELWLAPALETKRTDVRVDHWLSEPAPEAWGGQLELTLLGGAPKLTEAVLLHVPSKTLIVCDLVFNIHEARGWLAGAMLRMVGAHKRLGQSAFLRAQVSDKPAAAASARALLDLDFTRVVMAHGRVVEAPDARERVKAAMAKMLAWAG